MDIRKEKTFSWREAEVTIRYHFSEDDLSIRFDMSIENSHISWLQNHPKYSTKLAKVMLEKLRKHNARAILGQHQ